MRWGLLGGTFDPVHYGHLRCAEEILEIFNLNRIFFVPAARPAHKLEAEVTAFYQRADMIQLAIKDNQNFSFSNAENEKEGKSYSIETVEYMRSKFPKEMELFFILGQDAFHAITTWKDWERLLLMCNFVVMTRPGYANNGLKGIVPDDYGSQFVYDVNKNGFVGPTGYTIYFRTVTFLDISSSNIRSLAKQGKSISYLVPNSVKQYIQQQEIYK
ncbi:MAG: nicotinate-nucleotide adenylyltransferase [Deltaproteobacteria bacterium]